MNYRTDADYKAVADTVPVFCAHDKIVDIKKLIPNPRNPNTHPEDQIELLARIIEQTGWRAPITVSTASGYVVKGHGRLAAAKLKGWKRVPVDYQNYSSEAEEYADLLADNRIAELAEIDRQQLAEIFAEVDMDDVPLELTGYTDEALMELTDGLIEAIHEEGYEGDDWFETRERYDNGDLDEESEEYQEFVESHPGQPVLGSETSSCISTRGYYRFPVEQDKGRGWAMEPPFQVSSYDLYAPGWASCPDYEWAYEDKVSACAGEFVWTGYDYLGEPTPFNMDPSVFTNFHTEEEKEAYRRMVESWGQTISDVPLPSRSSYFGILDLAGFPKDRFWLYQARWRPDLPSAHILPHWTWPGREGAITPVHVYTSGDEAELFVNGKSQGRKAKEGYRIVWNDVRYAPGTVEVVAYKDGREWARDKVRTAGKAARAAASVDYDGTDLIYVTVDILDKAGVLVPDAAPVLSFEVKGPGIILATDAGDPTSHIPFYSHSLPAFHGKASVIVRRTAPGALTVRARAAGLKPAVLIIP